MSTPLEEAYTLLVRAKGIVDARADSIPKNFHNEAQKLSDDMDVFLTKQDDMARVHAYRSKKQK